MAKTLYDIKAGDIVYSIRMSTYGGRVDAMKVDRVTKVHIIIGSFKYRKSDGGMSGTPPYYPTGSIDVDNRRPDLKLNKQF